MTIYEAAYSGDSVSKAKLKWKSSSRQIKLNRFSSQYFAMPLLRRRHLHMMFHNFQRFLCHVESIAFLENLNYPLQENYFHEIVHNQLMSRAKTSSYAAQEMFFLSINFLIFLHLFEFFLSRFFHTLGAKCL